MHAELEALRRSGALSPHINSHRALVTSLIVNVTTECNLRCQYCFQQGLWPEEASIPLAIYEQALELVLKQEGLKSLTVTLFGGEPTLKPGLIGDMIHVTRDQCLQNRVQPQVDLFTNGSGVDKELLTSLEQVNGRVLLSWDAAGPENDEVRTGTISSLEAVHNALGYLERSPLLKRTLVRCTLTSANVNHLPALVREATARRIRHIVANPVCLAPGHPLALSTHDYQTLESALGQIAPLFVERMRKRRPFSLNLLSYPLAELLRSGVTLNRCGAGRHTIALHTDGAFYPCHYFLGKPGWSIGSALDGALPTFEFEVKYTGPCEACWVESFCSQRCPYCQEYLGTEILPDSPACRLNRLCHSMALSILDDLYGATAYPYERQWLHEDRSSSNEGAS